MSSTPENMAESENSPPATQYFNVAIFSDDSALVIQFASAFHNDRYRLYLARRRDELLAPDVLAEVDMVLIDEQMALLDTWNIARVTRQLIVPTREVAIIGFVESLNAQLMLQGRELGVDAFLLKSATGSDLADRIQFIARRVAARELVEGHASPFQSHSNFLQNLRGQIELVDAPASQSQAKTGAKTSSGGGTSRNTGDNKGSRATRFKRPTERGATTKGSSTERKLPDLSGKTFGKVRIEKEIGRGGGGVVYLAQHTSLDMKVAVKVLYPDLAERDPEFAAQFLAEARIAARISDGSVVRVFDCDRDDATSIYYIVMEFVQGTDLQDEIKRSGSLPEERILQIALETARCLMAAEQLGIIHRDIKPANILLTQTGLVKVADLGLAKNVSSAIGLGSGRLGTSSRVAKGPLVGTPYYMSPEQIENSPDIDSRTDVYSLGATLYHAAKGAVPFTGEDMGEILFHHLHTEATLLSDLKPEITPEFAKIVQKMMAKRIRQRYSSMRETYGVLSDHRDFLIVRKHRPEESAERPKTQRVGRRFFGKS